MRFLLIIGALLCIQAAHAQTNTGLSQLPPGVVAKIPPDMLAKIPPDALSKVPPNLLSQIPPDAATMTPDEARARYDALDPATKKQLKDAALQVKAQIDADPSLKEQLKAMIKAWLGK